MFGFGKKKQPKKQGQLDKILMGIIVGGAIGSVLGVGLAPKKGSETRKEVGRQTNKALREAGNLLSQAANKLSGLKKKPRIIPIGPTAKIPNGARPAGKSIPEEK